MSHGCWGFGPKAVRISPLGTKAQTLEEGPLPEWELNISIGCQIITLPAFFCLQSMGVFIYKTSENHLFDTSQRMRSWDAVTWCTQQILQSASESKLHDLLWVAWKERAGPAAEPWHRSFQIWAVTTKLSFLPPTATPVRLHWGRGKSSQCW